MRLDRLLSVFLVTGLCTSGNADMVVFENEGVLGTLALYDPNFGSQITGQSLDITRGVNDQPEIGDRPSGSVYFMHILTPSGDFVWLGTGMVTNTARASEGMPILDPWAGFPVDYFGPQDFAFGDSVGAGANFVDGWRAIHGFNDLTGTPGVFLTEMFFSVGIEFQMNGETHFGFAQFDRGFQVHNGFVLVDLTPVRWGYNDIAGEAATVIPAPAGVLAFGVLGGIVTRRRR